MMRSMDATHSIPTASRTTRISSGPPWAAQLEKINVLLCRLRGLRIIQSLPQLSLVPTPQEIGGDFSSFLTNVPAMAVDMNGNPTNQVALDCNGNPTYMGEVFNSRLAQNSTLNPSGVCGVPIGVTAGGVPTNIFPASSIDPLAARLSALFRPPTPM